MKKWLLRPHWWCFFQDVRLGWLVTLYRTKVWTVVCLSMSHYVGLLISQVTCTLPFTHWQMGLAPATPPLTGISIWKHQRDSIELIFTIDMLQSYSMFIHYLIVVNKQWQHISLWVSANDLCFCVLCLLHVVSDGVSQDDHTALPLLKLLSHVHCSCHGCARAATCVKTGKF